MMWKLFIEEGLYRDITTQESRNLLSCTEAFTPEGINVGWTEFETEEEAMAYFDIEKKPENLEEQNI